MIATPYDVNTELVSRALSAERDVCCEKSPALTGEELDEVEVWRTTGASSRSPSTGVGASDADRSGHQRI